MQSDYNPMEEPSWLQPAESPLAGEGTPTSALTATTGAAASTGEGLPADPQEVASFAPEGCAALASVEAANAAQSAAGPAAEPAPATELPDPVPFGSHRSGDHMVWTNEDGDIDALPWDMGGWSTGSSSERGSQQQPQQQQEPQKQQQPQQQSSALTAATAEQEQQQPGHPVDEHALIGALRRKVRPDLPTRSTRRIVFFCPVEGGIKAARFAHACNWLQCLELLTFAQSSNAVLLSSSAGPARCVCLAGFVREKPQHPRSACPAAFTQAAPRSAAVACVKLRRHSCPTRRAAGAGFASVACCRTCRPAYIS